MTTLCEFVVIRVAPDPIRNESVAVGVALFEPRQGGFSGVRLAPDFSRVRRLSPRFEPADLGGLARDLERRLAAASPLWNSREYLLQLSQESFSHSLQFTAPTAVLTADPAAELDRLYRQYAAPPEAEAAPAAVGARRRILAHLQRVFAQERVPRLPPVPAAQWLGAGDRFRFDFHYRGARDASVHLIQALDLAQDEAAVKELCFTVGRLRRLGRPDAAPRPAFDVAAFAEPDPPPPDGGDDPLPYRRELLADAGVRLLPLADAPLEAARIRAALALA